VVGQVLPGAIPAILSGPGFAADIAVGSPTALTLRLRRRRHRRGAGASASARRPSGSITPLTRAASRSAARPRTCRHCSRIAAGKGFGESAVAALIARSFAELTRFGVAYGARAETLAGLSGLGDLVLTGTSSRSRNRRLGEELGRGLSVEQAIAAAGLAEACGPPASWRRWRRRRAFDVPVAKAVADLIAGRLTVDAAIDVLLSRPPKAEH